MLLTTLRNAVRGKLNEKLNNLLTAQASVSSTVPKKPTKMANTSAGNNEKPLLRKVRRQEAAKKKSTPNPPGTVTLQILGSGSNGSPAVVYLFTDQSRYLFNCGEGTQRLAHEHKTKLARLEHLFLTRNTWPAIGGLPGLLLTVQDTGVPEISLHGPPLLDEILVSMNRFVLLKTLWVKTVDRTEIHDFEDDVMTVRSIPLYRCENENITEAYPSQENIAISYVCSLKPRPGPLNLEKCVEHGVPPGPLLGLLKNGMDVTLENGTIVKSEDVSEPKEKPLSFLFLDLPSKDFLSNLQKHKDSLVNTRINSDQTPELALVVHFSPADVINHSEYQTFLQGFAATTQHIFLNKAQNSFSGYMAAHRLQYQLNQLNDKVFPLMEEAKAQENNFNSSLKKAKLQENVNGAGTQRHSESLEFEQRLTDLSAMSVVHLRPRKGLDRSTEIVLNPSEYIKETQILADFPPLLDKLKNNYKAISYPKTDSAKFPIITFLGTGSCIPNKTRNVSSILIQTAEDCYALLDCGEGTLGQIVRMFGTHKAREVMKNLKMIYVSHLHADHHIGLIGLLTERLQLEQSAQKILLLAPKQIMPWLNFYQERIHNFKDTYELKGNADMLDEPLEANKTYGNMGIEQVQTCFVRHCPHSFGVKLTLSGEQQTEPISIIYSGDTMPCQDLVELGLNCTVLIHEATMENDLEEEARVKTHSTIAQAIRQGQAMQAKHIILTHFSQRYAKLPRLQAKGEQEDENAATSMSNVSIAFDNMQICLEDLQHYHLMYPAMYSMFASHAEELEQKALKRELKLERKRKLREEKSV